MNVGVKRVSVNKTTVLWGQELYSGFDALIANKTHG